MEFRRQAIPISLKDKVIFYHELATLEKAGIPILEALSLACENVKSNQLIRIIETIIEDISSRQTLSEAVNRHTGYFSPFERALIRTGEKTGSLEETFRNLRTWFELLLQFQRDILGNILYPVFLIHLGAVILNLPNFFQGGSLTSYLIHVLSFLAPFYFIAFCILYLIPFLRKNVPALLPITDRFILFIPFLGNLIRKIEMLRFCSSLKAALNAGVSIIEAIEISGDVCTNTYVREKVAHLQKTVEKGSQLHEGMEQTGFFPNMMVTMIKTGEKSGSLPEMTEKIVEHYTQETNLAIKFMTKAVSVLILLSVLSVVAFEIISFYTGHYSSLLK